MFTANSQAASKGKSRSKFSSSGERAAALLALAATIVVALALQLHAITAKSLWLDEGASISMARLDWYNFARIMWRREMNMVLYYLLLRGWLHLGDSVAFIRGLSVVFAVAAVPAIFLLGRRIQSTLVGIVSALLLSINAFQVRYAQEVRSYSLLVLLVVLSTYFFVSVLDGGRRRDWNWYVVTSTLGIYAHFFAVLVVVSHWVSFRFIERGKLEPTEDPAGDVRPQFKRALRLIALWTLPIWIFIATTGAGPIAWIPRPGINDIAGLFAKLSGNAEAPLLTLYLICAGVGVLSGILGVRRRQSEAPGNIILACWLLVPLLIVLLVSMARPVFAARYLIISLPAWILIAAVGITWLRPRLLGLALLSAVVWFGIAGVRSYYKADFDIGRNDVRSATTYILDHAQPGDAVVFYTLSTRFPYDYYAAHSPGEIKPDIVWPGTDSGMGWRDFMGSPSPSRVSELAKGHARLWMVTTSLPTEDPKLNAFQTAVERRYRLVDTQQFPYVYVSLFAQ